jgi:mutator protein MutT
MAGPRRDCVAAILVKDHEFLIEKRKLDDADPGFCELPGGHVEKNETLEEALRREMLEELGLTIYEMTFVFAGNHTASDGEKQRVHYFLVNSWKGTPHPNEAESVEWTSDSQVLSSDVDQSAVDKARTFLSF